MIISNVCAGGGCGASGCNTGDCAENCCGNVKCAAYRCSTGECSSTFLILLRLARNQYQLFTWQGHVRRSGYVLYILTIIKAHSSPSLFLKMWMAQIRSIIIVIIKSARLFSAAADCAMHCGIGEQRCARR